MVEKLREGQCGWGGISMRKYDGTGGQRCDRGGGGLGRVLPIGLLVQGKDLDFILKVREDILEGFKLRNEIF